jgi:uncharacterized protein
LQVLDGDWVYSPADLVARMECDHRSALDLAHATGLLEVEPREADGLLATAADRGGVHEQRVLATLRMLHTRVVEISEPQRSREGYRRAAEQTARALAEGADVVYQACFFDERFLGFADFVIRTPDGYEVYDAKLARRAKPSALLQLAAYSEQVYALGLPMPARLHVWLGDDTLRSFAVDDVLPTLRRVRWDLEARLGVAAAVPARLWGDKRSGCALCRWADVCAQGRFDARDLSLVASMRGDQRRRLLDAGIGTVEALGIADDAQRPPGMGAAAFERLRAQAAMQAAQDASRTPDDPLGEVTAEYFSDDGVRLMPEACEGDVWFDMEGDPFEGRKGLEYLFGYVTVGRAGESDPGFTPIWAHTPHEEKAAFEQFVDAIEDRMDVWPDMHVYHYGHYERAALSRLAQRHGTREEEIDRWLREGRLVDLMRVFKGSFRVSQDSYSLKSLEALYGLQRTGEVTTAGDSVVDYEQYLALVSSGDDGSARDRLRAIEAYNRVDCVSTLRLDRWLRTYAESWRILDVLDPDSPTVAAVPVEPAEDASSLYDDLLEGVPDEGRSAEQQAAAMVHAALAYFGREARPGWWRHYDRLDASADEWEADREVLVVTGGRAGPWVPKRTNAHRELDLALADGGVQEHPPGSTVYLVYDHAVGGMRAGQVGGRGWTEAEVVSHAGPELRVRAEKLPIGSAAPAGLPQAVLPAEVVHTTVLQESVQRFALDWLRDEPSARRCAATDLLLRRPPRMRSGGGLADAGDPAADIECAVRDLDDSYLAVQGPPGAGKTHVGAEVITSLVRSGWRVGVVAQSHRAVENMLDKVVELGLDPALIAKESKRGAPQEKPYHRRRVDEWMSGHVGGALVGGTAWLFCRAGLRRQAPLDLLVVDEAGQFSIGFTVALWHAARNVLLLGDPQQLPQVSQGVHPEPLNESALGWLAGGAAVLPAQFGYFLDQTRRMSGEVTEVVSRLSYERRLSAHPDVKLRHLLGVDPGVHPVPVGHSDRTVHAPEEVAAVVDLAVRHVGLPWSQQDRTAPLRPADIMVVAPFNAQVDALRRALRAVGLGEVPVGTVDSFQGREAALVIVSMTASSREELPRGLGFVLSRNRLNTAVSRSQWASFVVHSPELGACVPGTAEEMLLVGAFLGVVGANMPAVECHGTVM